MIVVVVVGLESVVCVGVIVVVTAWCVECAGVSEDLTVVVVGVVAVIVVHNFGGIGG